MKNEILLTTTEHVAGKEVVAVLGIVRGNTIQTRHVGSDIMASLKSLVGGEIKGYVKAMIAARVQADERMIAEAKALGADAVICTRYSTSQIMDGAAEILAYGTAVKLR